MELFQSKRGKIHIQHKDHPRSVHNNNIDNRYTYCSLLVGWDWLYLIQHDTGRQWEPDCKECIKRYRVHQAFLGNMQCGLNSCSKSSFNSVDVDVSFMYADHKVQLIKLPLCKAHWLVLVGEPPPPAELIIDVVGPIAQLLDPKQQQQLHEAWFNRDA